MRFSIICMSMSSYSSISFTQKERNVRLKKFSLKKAQIFNIRPHDFQVPWWWFDILTESFPFLDLLEVPAECVSTRRLDDTAWFSGNLRLFFLIFRAGIPENKFARFILIYKYNIYYL